MNAIFFFFFNNFWSSLCFINWWQLFFPVVCELWFPDYREKTRLKPVKLGAPTVSDVNTKSPYPHYYYLSFWTFVHSKIFFLLLGEKLRREESFFLFFLGGCGGWLWFLDLSTLAFFHGYLSQFILKYIIGVPQKIQNLVELLHFHPTISALGVMNELRKEERFVLYLSYCSFIFSNIFIFQQKTMCIILLGSSILNLRKRLMQRK